MKILKQIVKSEKIPGIETQFNPSQAKVEPCSMHPCENVRPDSISLVPRLSLSVLVIHVINRGRGHTRELH